MYQQIINWKDGTYTIFLSKKLSILNEGDIIVAETVIAEDVGQLLGGS